MKKRWIAVAGFLTLAFVPAMVLASFDLSIKNEYGDTYYGELSSMYERLTATKENKIVIIGNSNVAFGVDSKQFEELFPDYSVVNFGLYGSIGTKAMLDLSEDYIGEGDIVILVPEEYPQSMSLYFSASDFWYSLDGNRKMFYDLDSSAREALVGNYTDYVAKKFASRTEKKDYSDLGVYSSSSFDEHCDMTRYDRDYNILFNDYDENNPIELSLSLLDEDFLDYVNEYSDTVTKRGAKMYYSFSPMNKEAIVSSDEEIDAFYNALREKLTFPVISDIDTYIMDKEWFYDSNYHLNESGMHLRTSLLVDDLKNELGITTKTDFAFPEKPVKPDSSIEGEGDNSCADCFTYEREGNYYVITGLTEKGEEKEELIIPYQVEGIYISEFTKDVFSYDKKIRKITIQKNITEIFDESFYGCESLEGVYLEHESPSDISVGFNLLVGTAADIYVPSEIRRSFVSNYFWGSYAERIQGYEKA